MPFTAPFKIVSKFIALSTLSIGLALSSVSLSAHEHNDSNLGFTTTELSSGLYMVSGVGGFTGGNIALVVGDEGVVMIDNGLSSVLDLLKAEIAKTTSLPIDYLINTHLHGDHIGNNASLSSEGAKIISHENLRASLKNNNEEKGSLPVMTFSDKMTLHINGDAAQIIHIKNAHTNGDAIIKFEKANIIHTGDLMFNGLFPFIDGSNGGTLDGVIDGLNRIVSLSDANTKIIPGHGPLASKADVEKTIAVLKDAKGLVANLIKQGKSDTEIFAINPLSKYQQYSWGFINTEKMTKQVISNLR